jgi:3-oxoacyl-[acyl-carrier-protein] synthase II
VKAPGGLSADELFASVCAARPCAEPYEDERLSADAAMLTCRVVGFDDAVYLSGAEARRLDRCQKLAIGAAQDALTGIELPAPERCAVVCGVGLGASATYEAQVANLHARGPRGVSPLAVPLIMPSSTAAHLSLRFGFRGPAMTVSAACASGAVALGEAVELLRRGAADLVLAGGVESLGYGATCAFLRLDAMTRNVTTPQLASRPFDVDRDGFVIGEGAGFVVLVRAVDTTAALGYLLGYGTSSDAYHLVAPPPDGEGALRCMRLALDDAGVTGQDVNHVNAHGTSTPLNDLAEARALQALFGATTPPVTSIKGSTGHLIAAAGAVEAIMTLWSLRHGLVPPIAGLRTVDPEFATLDAVHDSPRRLSDGGCALSNSFGFGGVNASLVVGLTPSVG